MPTITAAASAPPISSALVVGAGFLLLGSALAMAAPLDFYAKKRWTAPMERWGRWFAFGGAVAVLVGATEELHGQNLEVAAAVVLLAIAVLSALLLLPVFVRVRPRPEDDDGEERHSKKAPDINVVIARYAYFDARGSKTSRPQNRSTEPNPVADPQGEPHIT